MWTGTNSTAALPGPWIHSRRWDGLFIFGSVALVTVPLLTYWSVTTLTGAPPKAFQHDQALGVAMLINLGAAFLIGGPHMYATYTLTLGEERFRRRHPWLLRAAAFIPPLVVFLAVVRIELLMTIFFAWASVHVVHQIVYIVGQYQQRAGRSVLPPWSRVIDYALASSCLYPLVFWRLLAPSGEVLRLPFGLEVSAGFSIGRVDLAQQLPSFVRGHVWIAHALAALFVLLLAAFVLRTLWEVARGQVVWTRTIFLGLTVPVAFSVASFDNLDVSLQGFNLWHSAQYIGLVYLMNRRRRDRGLMSSQLVSAFSRPGRGWEYYTFIVTISLAAGGLTGALHYGLGLPLLHVYYSVLLSGLWIHYLWDHAVFTQWNAFDSRPWSPLADSPSFVSSDRGRREAIVAR